MLSEAVREYNLTNIWDNPRLKDNLNFSILLSFFLTLPAYYRGNVGSLNLFYLNSGFTQASQTSLPTHSYDVNLHSCIPATYLRATKPVCTTLPFLISPFLRDTFVKWRQSKLNSMVLSALFKVRIIATFKRYLIRKQLALGEETN